MLSRTRAIVLHLSKHTDKTSIAHLYTRRYGRVNCVVYGIGSSRGKQKRGIFRPLTIIETDADFEQQSKMPVLALGAITVVTAIQHDDIIHNSVVLFLSEVLYKSLQHPLSDIVLFDWLEEEIKALDASELSPNQHIRFLINYAKYLGIMPDIENNAAIEIDSVLDEQTHTKLFSRQETEVLSKLIRNDDVISRRQRQILLDKLCKYYMVNIDGFTYPKSIDMLTEIFNTNN